jgi:hypothetical protein
VLVPVFTGAVLRYHKLVLMADADLSTASTLGTRIRSPVAPKA